MRAVVVTRHGGPEVLELRQEPEPVPGDAQLLVEVEAAGVNFRDIYERQGDYGGTTPHVAGIEGAGSVVALGEGVEGFRPGERVAWVASPGSYAERVLVDAARAVPVPDGVSSELAAAVLLQGMTAQYLALTTYPVSEGDDVLVHAAAGGVGLLITQVVRLRGGRVLASAGTEEKRRLALDNGADEVFDYDGFPERVRELTGGEGVHVVYDGIGRATFDGSLASLRRRGYLVLYGSASGPPEPVDTRRLAAGGSLVLTRPTLVDFTVTRQELLARAADVFSWLAAGELEVHVGGRYPLESARQAQEDLAARRTTGKLLLLPGGPT